MIKKQLRIFLAGVMVVTPFLVTAYVVWWAGSGLDAMVLGAIKTVAPGAQLFRGLGVLILVAGIYAIGLLTHWWLFRWALGLLEKIFSRLPVVKTIYESVRDVLGLFGGDTERMGQVVRYRVPGTGIELLGIRTTTAPRANVGPGKVAVYLPMSYMFGGLTVYVPDESVEPMDMSVEQALKLAATAEAGGPAQGPAGQKGTPPSGA